MADASDRCSEALAGVSSVLRDITKELQNAQLLAQHWKIEADAWKARCEQEQARNKRLRRVLRCTPLRDTVINRLSLAVPTRAPSATGSIQRFPSLTQRTGGSIGARYSCDDSSSLQDRREYGQEDGMYSAEVTNSSSTRPCASHLKCLVEEPELLPASSTTSAAADAGAAATTPSGSASSTRSSSGQRPLSKSHDGSAYYHAAEDDDDTEQHQNSAAAIQAATRAASAAASRLPDPFARCSQTLIPDYDTAVAPEASSGEGPALPDSDSFSFTPVSSCPAGMHRANSDQTSSLVQPTPQPTPQQQPQQQQRQVECQKAVYSELARHLIDQTLAEQQEQQQTPPPVRRSATLPRSFSYGSGRSVSRPAGSGVPAAAFPSGQWSSFSSTCTAAFGAAVQQQQHSKHTVDQLLRMMMAFTIMQGGGPGGQGDADGFPGGEGNEDEPLPTVSLDDDDGSSGVGLAAAAAVSAAMARAWASAASKEQRAVAAAAAAAAAAGNTVSSNGETGGAAAAQRAGFRLVATVTNKMGKRAASTAALHSIGSQDSMDASGSSLDLPGMSRVGSGLHPNAGTAAAGNIARKGSGGSSDGIDQQQQSSNSSSRPPLAPAQSSSSMDGSNTSKLSPGSSGTGGTAAAAAAATAATRDAAGAAPNTGQATAISLHWLSKPRTVLVMRKLAPSTEPSFLKALEWLRRHNITIYVEPKVYQELLDTGRVQPAPELRSSGSTSCLAGMLVNTTAGDATGDGHCSSLTSYSSWPAHSRYTCSSSSSSSRTAMTAAPPAGPASAAGAATGCYGLIKTWQPEVLLNQQGDSSTQTESVLIPEGVTQQLDLVVVLGGDGTVLWTCHIFGNRSVPPLVPFNLGSLGFLTPFDPASLEQVLHKTLRGGFPITLRHRLHATIVRGANSALNCSQSQPAAVSDSMPAVSRSCLGNSVDGEEHVALNEVVIERGISPFLTNLECFCDGAFVTHVQGDGLIIGTPTGSTAYSLAAGGSMVHPQVPCILFTPICPHSLSFRPLMFPDYCQLCIQVPVDSRGHVWASFDGKDRTELVPGDAVVVRLSRWPVPSVAAEADPSGDWFSAVRECLHWNMRKVQGGAGA